MLLYGAALIAAVGGAAWAIFHRPPEPAREAPRTETPVQKPPGEPEPPLEPPDLPDVPDLANEPPPPRPEGDPRMSSLGAEMRYLSRAQQLLEDQPARAYELLDEHRRAHPDGVLAEEREAFAIEALLALERREEAERRYTDFLRRFPQSDFTERLSEMLR